MIDAHLRKNKSNLILHELPTIKAHSFPHRRPPRGMISQQFQPHWTHGMCKLPNQRLVLEEYEEAAPVGWLRPAGRPCTK